MDTVPVKILVNLSLPRGFENDILYYFLKNYLKTNKHWLCMLEENLFEFCYISEIDIAMSWYGAEQYCQEKYSGHLASFDSDWQWSLVRLWVWSHMFWKYNSPLFYIGLAANEVSYFYVSYCNCYARIDIYYVDVLVNSDFNIIVIEKPRETHPKQIMCV